MAATDTHNPAGSVEPSRQPLDAQELRLRLREEIGRAERHGTALCCLLVALQDPAELARANGERMPAQALEYMSRALGFELRRFDRVGWLADGELLVLLPGADERRGEIVARRALRRLRAVKLEQSGERRAIALRIGLAAWCEGVSDGQLVEQSRLAACPTDGRARRSPLGRS